MKNQLTAKYILETVQIDDSGVCEFEAQMTDATGSAVHTGLTVSTDLLNLLLSPDDAVVKEVLSMLRDLHAQQFEGQFYDDEALNYRHCVHEVNT